MAENKTLEHLPEVRAAVAALSPEDREVLAAVQASPFKLTAPEQFKEFAANIDYFVFEPNMETEPLPFRIQETAGNAFSGKYRASCRKCNGGHRAQWSRKNDTIPLLMRIGKKM